MASSRWRVQSDDNNYHCDYQNAGRYDANDGDVGDGHHHHFPP